MLLFSLSTTLRLKAAAMSLKRGGGEGCTVQRQAHFDGAAATQYVMPVMGSWFLRNTTIITTGHSNRNKKELFHAYILFSHFNPMHTQDIAIHYKLAP